MKNANNSITINISNKSIIRVLIAIAVVFALLQLTDLVLVVLTSIVIASFVKTVSEKLKTYRIPKALSVLTMYILGFLSLAGLFYFFIPVLIVELSKLIPVIVDLVPDLMNSEAVVGAQSIATSISEGAVVGDILNSLQNTLSSFSSGFFGFISSLFGNIINVVLIVVISFYLSMADDGVESFLRIVTPRKHEAYVIDLWHRSQRKIAHWFRGQMLLALIISLMTFVGLALLGVEYALLLAVIAAFAELIPFGIIFAAIPAVSLAFATGGLPLAILVVILYVVIQQIENYVLQPLIVGKVTGISPIAIILAVLISLKLAGFWGLILAIPVSVTLLEYIKDLEKEKNNGTT